MTTRRSVLIMAGGAALLSGCRESAPPAGTGRVSATAPDLLLVEHGSALTRVVGDRLDDLGAGSLLGPGAAEIVSVVTSGGATTLLGIDPATGRRTGRGALGGRWHPRAVSPDGRSCALTDAPPEPSGGPPAARQRTSLAVLGPAGQRRVELPGVVEPDAFTTDGTGLFVLQWQPAGAPDHYRVRLLDLASGTLGPLLTRDKRPVPSGAEEQMRGAGRQAVLGPDRQVLYTLYTHQGQHRHTRDLLAGRPGGVHAFVHVLHLDQRWAYCVDLPEPFGRGAAAGHAMALSPDGGRLCVVDLGSGSLARIDTQSLAVQAVSAVPAAAGAAAMVARPGGPTAFLGADKLITALDTATGAPLARWTVPGPVSGLGVSPDGNRVYVGSTGAVTWLDAATGALLGRVRMPGLTALREVR